MSISKEEDVLAQIRAENVGGIDYADVDLGPGVNILTGRNATNRTSFLQAVMAAMGGEHVSLKGDAENGEVELDLGDETFTRTLTRENSHVSLSGEPYLDDAEVAELFAFLLEDNEARQAVTRKDDLREVIMRPVDTAEIQAEIENIESEKRQVDQELEHLDDLKSKRPELEQRRNDLEGKIDAKKEELEAKRAELEEVDASVEESREKKNELDEALDDLQKAQSELEDVEFRLETERESLEALRDDREELEAELDELDEAPMGEVSEIESKIEQLRNHKQSLDSTVSQLQRIVQFNEEMLDGENRDVRDALDADSSGGALTDQLVEDTTVCWTCGSEVERDAVNETLGQLRDLRREKAAERSDVKSQLEDLKSEKRSYEQQQQERDRLERRLNQVENEVDDREQAIENLQEQRADLEERVDDLEDHVEELEEREQSEVLSVHKTVNQLEFELDRLQKELDSVEEEIEEVKTEIAREEELEAERETIQDQLTDLRTRIERLEKEAVESFNDHMQTILEILEYENLARIWIERTEKTVREGRRKVTRGSFDLHVVRATDEGTTYEDTIDHLSESEREVTGLVFALAGYLVHDVHETVPFMLLDSLEAIDSERIAHLIEYFEDYPDYLVVALLPEDAQALDDEYRRVTQI